MEQFNASITVGMTRSNVVMIMGQPYLTDTQSWRNKGWVADIYHFDPPVLHFGTVTDGFNIVFSNDIVIKKDPTVGSMQ